MVLCASGEHLALRLCNGRQDRAIQGRTFPWLSLCDAERYKKSHPEVLVHLLVENTRRCCAAVARGEVNLAIVGGDIPRELEHLIQVC